MNGINFSEGMPLSSELIQHILCFASAEQLGPLIEQRRVCKLFDSNVKGLLKSRWTALSKSEDGEFKNSVIGKNIIQIEDPDNLALIKFQKLATKLGILPKYLPINKDGLETIWDTTMKTLWQEGGLHSLLAQYSTEIPTLDAKASDIFNFLNTVTFESIGCLDFSNLGLQFFPSQILESFPNLVTLDLSYNKMKMLQVQSNSLKQLCINNNELISIPDADCPNLHTLNLENNKITQFNYPKACVKLTELILNKNLIEKFDLRSPTLRVLELSENPLSQINNLICPQLVSFSAQPSDEAQSEQLIQVNGRLHCPQLLPEHVNGLAIDRAEYQKTYELAVEQNEQAQQIICEHRLSHLVFETYQIEDEELTQNLNTLLNSVCLKENFSTFRGITELNLSDLRLKTFPISLLQYFPDLENLDLRGNTIDNLQDLEGYPNLIVAFDGPK